MYKQIVTLFNYLSSSDDYISTVINGVEVQPIYATTPKVTNTENDTSVLIIIKCFEDSNGRYIHTENGNKYYKPPKQWKENTNYFTLQPNFDFLILGKYEIQDISLNELKNNLDNIFMVNQIKDFSDDLGHFEIIAN